MRFRDDIDLARTWVISDTHFGHRNINDFANRPPDHESLMLDRIAQNVGPDDTLLHLGDLCYSNNAAFRALVAPHITGGRKLLIAGNHDKGRYSFYKKCGFKMTRPFALPIGIKESANDLGVCVETRDPYWHVSFAHYPWDDEEEGRSMNDAHDFYAADIRVHGHIHTAGYTRAAYVPFLKNHINVSVEQTNYQPVRLDNLLDGALLGSYDKAFDPMLPDTETSDKNAHVIERFNAAAATHGS
jgi:calcineurin-like phosphoesterase family protein